MRELTDQEKVRREKAENIKKLGMDPFGQKFERTDYAIEIKDNRLVCELYFSNYFVDKYIQYNKIIEYLNKLHLKPAQNAWKNGYHLNVRFGNIEISSDFMYNNEEEKKDIWSKLDKIMIPVLKNEKETYDRD